MEFAAKALGIRGPFLPQWQERVRKVLHGVVHAFDAVEELLALTSPVCELTVRKPLSLAVSTTFVRWPDVTQPSRYFTGFKVVGNIEPSGVFREVKPQLEILAEDFLGEAAIEFVDELMTRRTSKDANAIWELTLEEQSKG